MGLWMGVNLVLSHRNAGHMKSLRPFSGLKLRSVKFTVKSVKFFGFSAFTLAELIVVVTILAILATVGFIALS